MLLVFTKVASLMFRKECSPVSLVNRILRKKASVTLTGNETVRVTMLLALLSTGAET